ncbi:hypothetical protein JYU07_00780, partial [Roseiflexus sp. AH-315-K22]|nr:hypothetical protein [Roseiflexus sp. AH-315-K22]
SPKGRGCRLPLPLGEGWGEGLWVLVCLTSLTSFTLRVNISSPKGRGCRKAASKPCTGSQRCG